MSGLRDDDAILLPILAWRDVAFVMGVLKVIAEREDRFSAQAESILEALLAGLRVVKLQGEPEEMT